MHFCVLSLTRMHVCVLLQRARKSAAKRQKKGILRASTVKMDDAISASPHTRAVLRCNVFRN
jgi:hypothetical protein